MGLSKLQVTLATCDKCATQEETKGIVPTIPPYWHWVQIYNRYGERVCAPIDVLLCPNCFADHEE